VTELEECERVAVESDLALRDDLLAAAPEAARELYRRFAPRLLAFAASRFPADRQLAEDVTVQSLANAARNIRGFDPRKSTLTAWLYGIARRQIRDEVRSRTRQKSVPADALSPLDEATGIPSDDDIAASVATRIDAERLMAQLKSLLSDVEFEILVLSAIDRLSAREIGSVVGRSERAVHSLLHRARTKARERLTTHGQ